MSSFATNPHPPRSTMYDLSDHQLCLIMKSAIPRLDVMHKILNFIKVMKLDGKAFMTLPTKKLTSLANYDPLIISKFQELRVAQPQDIQILLGSRREPTPEPTTPEETPEDLHEEATDPISYSQSDPVDDHPIHVDRPPVPDSHHLTPDIVISTEAAPIFTEEGGNMQNSTDVSQNGSSLNREPATWHPDADETPSSLEPAVLEFTSPTDPHAVPLLQPYDSGVDLLNVEENDTYHHDVSSGEEAVGSDLEPERLSTDDDISDDESQAWSVVDHEEAHVSVENEVQELQAGSSSPFGIDVTRESFTENTSSTIVDAAPTQCNHVDFDAAPAAQSHPVGQSDFGLDQIISAGVSDSDGRHSDGSEVEQWHEAELSLPTPPLAENRQEVSPKDPPTSIVSEPELSGDVQEAMTVHESVNLGQSPPNRGADQPQIVHVISIPESEPETPEFDQVTTPSVEDGPTSAGAFITEENTLEVTYPELPVSTEDPFAAVVDDLPEEHTSPKPVTNEIPAIRLSDLDVTDFESAHLSHSERLLPSLSHLVVYSPSEVHGESVHDSATALHSTEELDFISLEDSAYNDDIPIANVVFSPTRVSVELDMSVSASPASSSRSVFSDSPISNRFYSDFHFVSPVSPVLRFDGGHVLFCEGNCEEYSTFLTSSSIDVAHILPFTSKSAVFEEINLPADFDGQTTNELRLVDHVLPTDDDTAPDDLMSFFPVEDPFYISSYLDESSQIDELASSSSVNLINLLDDGVDNEDPTASEFISASVLDEDRAEATDPASAMCDTVPVVPLSSVSGMIERQPTSVSDNPEEDSILSDDVVGQQALNEPTSDEALSETWEEVELSRFKGLPSINTNITSLLDELSAYLSPENSTTHNPIVHVSPPTPSTSRPRISSGSPTRSLFPMSERVASEKTIANYTNYTKRRHSRQPREAIETPVARSDIAIQTDLDSQHPLRLAPEEYSTIGNIASTLVSPLSTVSASFRQLFGFGGDRARPEGLPFRSPLEIEGGATHPPS